MKTKKISDLYISFFKIGGLTFGGGLAMLPMLQREVVKKHEWCTEEELLDIYAIGQCTPGIIAVNTATYVGYQQAGFLGSVAGTLGMVSPSLIIICLVASILNNFIHMPVVLHALAGIRIVVCALMLNTVFTMAKKGIIDRLGALVFVIAFLLACFTPVPTAVVIVLAGLTGIIAKYFERRRSA
ncbi:MAG: chromate transporter [Lachnospiraceae bacterium]